MKYNSKVIPFTSLPEGWAYSSSSRVLSIDPLQVTEFGSFTLMARLIEFPKQSTSDSTKTIFTLIAPAACKVEQIIVEQPYLKFFYALGSGPQSFPLSKYKLTEYKHAPDSCEMQIDRIQVIPLTNSSVPFVLAGKSLQID